ncbi:acetate/propionate family kinase [Rhodovarius crocodyli]|uniref:Acetate kinase n=1 Tax=Rhodovarius crocodyli TaxID=1979269 RepID=A0A437M2D0_9PROT|nr:acetate/propionate family kinase [Rhodovarius crocodyli]RVT91736.1 acetate/propionate family kinase [Rhodovarius crocodyli]
MSEELLVTFNAGSSTVKIGLFEMTPGGPRRVARGVIDQRSHPPRLTMQEGPGSIDIELAPEAAADMQAALAETFAHLSGHFDPESVVAIGHRVVHGGDVFAGPARIDDAVLEAIDKLTALAPLHQPKALSLIRALHALRPGMPQFASFDTAFHRGNAEVVRRFAIPRALHEQGVKRYGFHGLSYKYVAAELARRAPGLAAGRVVIAHLGSGASLCALAGGVSRDSSMGFSTLDGIPMATRCGALDPGVLLHLLAAGMSVKELERTLYNRSGLLGVSGISADSRVLLESDRPEAREAIELFTFRTAGEVARLAATLGGLDAIVFTAGIGEHQPVVRAGICERLAWLGLRIDAEANARNAPSFAAPGSTVGALVIPTDEEEVIASEAFSLARG